VLARPISVLARTLVGGALEVEDPSPAQVLDKQAADGRAQTRRDDHAEPVDAAHRGADAFPGHGISSVATQLFAGPAAGR
jgi:hypothetical protein